MKLPRAVQNVIDKFERLPGIGPKSAQRLAFYLLHNPAHELEDFAQTLIALKRDTVLCQQCHNVSDRDPCRICSDSSRDATLLCIVEQPLDVIALELSGAYTGKYHVLHGHIAPLQNIGPEQLYLHDVRSRIEGVTELLIATNPTMEGEATALYIREYLHEHGTLENISITRIGRGLPIGADIEYADRQTLARALEGRKEL